MDRKHRDSSRFLYKTRFGRMLLKPISTRPVSRVCGRFLDSRLSKPLAKRYMRRNNIDPAQYYGAPYRTFNSCFTRRIREECRPIDMDPDSLISPCDGYLSAYRIRKGTILPVKQSRYTISSLLDNSALADRYKDGICLVFRLSVNQYHRYCYIDEAEQLDNRFIPGQLHSVRPIALEKYPVFIRNCREYTVMQTKHFGTVTQVEVGALLVGKIVNHQGSKSSRRGEEKGMFEYGGSTIILLFEKNTIVLPESLFRNSDQGREQLVQLGEKIGEAKRQDP